MALRGHGSAIFRVGTIARFLIASSALFGCLIFAPMTVAAPSDLDPGFGSGGKVIFPMVPSEDGAADVAVQLDGKIVVGGQAYTGSNYDFAAASFNADGSPDITFSGDGTVTQAIGSGRDEGHDVAVQPDGKVLVAGLFDGGPVDFIGLVRFDSAGVPDPTFGAGDGVAYYGLGTPGSFETRGHALALQPDGKILVVGRSNAAGNDDFAVIRVDSAGVLDPTFSGDGKLSVPVSPATDLANDVTVQPDGKILVAGYGDGPGASRDFALARINSDGTLDAAFDGDGIVTTDISGEDDAAEGVTVRPDGSIIVAGHGETAGVDHIAVARYSPSGALDPAFGVGGIVKTPAMTGEYRGKSVVLQNNDKIVVAGYHYDGLYTDFLVAQYLATGALDPAFDVDGLAHIGIGATDDLAYGAALQPDGKIVVAGQTDVAFLDDVSLVRLTGELPVVPTALVPVAKITSPRRRVLSARKLRKLAGTAGPAGEVAKVEIALRRVDKRALKRKRCIWLRNSAGRFVKTKAVRKRCTKHRFLRASGTEKWSFKLKRRLPKGRYELSVRVTLKNGTRNDTFRAADGTFRAFRLK